MKKKEFFSRSTVESSASTCPLTRPRTLPTRAQASDEGTEANFDSTSARSAVSTLTRIERANTENRSQLSAAPQAWSPLITGLVLRLLILPRPVGFAQAACLAEVMSDSPIAYWRLEEGPGSIPLHCTLEQFLRCPRIILLTNSPIPAPVVGSQ